MPNLNITFCIAFTYYLDSRYIVQSSCQAQHDTEYY